MTRTLHVFQCEIPILKGSPTTSHFIPQLYNIPGLMPYAPHRSCTNKLAHSTYWYSYSDTIRLEFLHIRTCRCAKEHCGLPEQKNHKDSHRTTSTSNTHCSNRLPETPQNTPPRPKTTSTYSSDLSRCSDVIQWPTEVIT